MFTSTNYNNFKNYINFNNTNSQGSDNQNPYSTFWCKRILLKNYNSLLIDANNKKLKLVSCNRSSKSPLNSKR